MSETKWWKCDLQVATPAWNFRFPANSAYDIDSPEGRQVFLDDYMAAVRDAGIEIIALADHNTGEWIDAAKAAGARHGVIVFPGCEITTHTGADGVHLIILGDLDKTSQDFDRLIYGALGFGDEHPPFHRTNGLRSQPGSSSKTLIQILDDLPEGYLAVAPHALNDNGIASRDSVQGDLRYKALHHERLVAVDPGNCADVIGDAFNSRFRRRELDNFPRLRDLAFLSMSDAYSMDEVGSRFAWIRMGNVSIEGLRQAFLDHESRVLCDWSPVLAGFPERNPNIVRHAWITSVRLAGQLTNSAEPLSLSFHPSLNVIIGGRGSGKSSVVAALRALYSSSEGLPPRLMAEADGFVDTVFAHAELTASHRVQESQELQESRWTRASGSVTEVEGLPVPTRYPVTVISQKELFERAAGDKNDRYLSSRSLLALIDASVGLSGSDTRSVDSYGRRSEDARSGWLIAVRNYVLLVGDLGQLPGLKQQETTLQKQVDAFSSEEVKQRLSRIDVRTHEAEGWNANEKSVEQALTSVRKLSEDLRSLKKSDLSAQEPYAVEYAHHLREAQGIVALLIEQLDDIGTKAGAIFEKVRGTVQAGAWYQDVLAARADFEAYKLGLEQQGLSTSEFNRIQGELSKVREAIRTLEEKEPSIEPARQRVAEAWEAILALVADRRAERQDLLNEVQARSERLRFRVIALADTAPWVEVVREMSGFRADAFLDDVPALAAWLWEGAAEGLSERWEIWRDALATGEMTLLQREAKLRPQFVERLKKLDETVKLRVASQVPDDVVMMEFLKEGGVAERDADWQSITQGSPGQRTAAMLAFVLHHGREPLILDQPEDDLDSEWISRLVVKELRQSRWSRQLIVVSHNANIPVLGDADQVVALENRSGVLSVRSSKELRAAGEEFDVLHVGPVENRYVRHDIQAIMEGGVAAFVRREQKYHNETQKYRTR